MFSQEKIQWILVQNILKIFSLNMEKHSWKSNIHGAVKIMLTLQYELNFLLPFDDILIEELNR